MKKKRPKDKRKKPALIPKPATRLTDDIRALRKEPTIADLRREMEMTCLLRGLRSLCGYVDRMGIVHWVAGPA